MTPTSICEGEEVLSSSVYGLLTKTTIANQVLSKRRPIMQDSCVALLGGFLTDANSQLSASVALDHNVSVYAFSCGLRQCLV